MRAIRAPIQSDIVVGAVAEHGALHAYRENRRVMGVSTDEFLRLAMAKREEIDGLAVRLRRGRPPLEVRGKTVIVVDDGVATGATASAALHTLRVREPAWVVLAVPVGSSEVLDSLESIADEVVCPFRQRRFFAVAPWYEQFERPMDGEVWQASRSQTNRAQDRHRYAFGIVLAGIRKSTCKEASSMSSFQSILVPVDFGEPSTCALRFAIDIAKRFRSAVTLVHTWEIPAYVYPGIEITPTDFFHPMKDAAQHELDRALAEVRLEISSAQAVLKIGIPWRETLATIKELTPDLVVMGTHGRRGLGRALMGSVTEKIVRTSPAPVLTVGPRRHPSREDEAQALGALKHILVPTDFGDASGRALDLALDLATKFDAKITLVHSAWLPPYYYAAYAEGLAWPTDELEGKARTELDTAVANARARYPKIDGVLVTGDAWERILDASKERGADLIVMGTHGHRGLSRVLLGSVAEKVVRLSAVPVLTASAEAQRRARERALTENVPHQAATIERVTS